MGAWVHGGMRRCGSEGVRGGRSGRMGRCRLAEGGRFEVELEVDTLEPEWVVSLTDTDARCKAYLEPG